MLANGILFNLGGFSKVRLGTHLLTGEKVAIKCMDKQKLGEDVLRIKTEINALRVLDHPSIAKLLQVIETKDRIYLILEVSLHPQIYLRLILTTLSVYSLLTVLQRW